MSLHYKIYGASNKTPLIMIHGFLCSGSFFASNIETLKNHFTVITIDLPGFGLSAHQMGEKSIEEMAISVLDTINAIGISNYYLLGHSMGGMVALNMTLMDNRINKVITYATHSDGCLTERFESFDETKQRFKNNFKSHIEKVIATWFQQGSKHPDFSSVMQCSANVTLDTALNALDAMKTFNITHRLKNMTIPALIIAAEFDRTYTQKSIQQLKKALPQAQYRLIKNASHNAHLEEKKIFNDIIINFLS